MVDIVSHPVVLRWFIFIFLYIFILDPEWASYTLGVFLCFECCGVHRALGTHLTRTKSIKVDNWDDEQVLVNIK